MYQHQQSADRGLDRVSAGQIKVQSNKRKSQKRGKVSAFIMLFVFHRCCCYYGDIH